MTKLHYYLKIVTVAGGLLAAGPLFAAPMVSVGNNMDIFFNGSAGLQMNDNLALDESNELDDFVFNLKPGVEFVLGRGQTNAELSVLYQYDIVRYSEEDQFDTELNNFLVNGSFEGAKVSGSANFSFIEVQDNTVSANITGSLIESEITRFGADGEFAFSQKTSFGAGVQYVDTAYVGAVEGILPDRDTLSIPINAYYAISEKLDVSLGYRYRTTDIDGGNDPDDHNFSIGVRGELTPKLTGTASVGYQTRNFTVGSFEDTNGLSADVALTWEATPKVTVDGNLYSDFNLGGAGQTIDEQGFRFDARYAINSLWYLRGQLGFSQLEYIGEGRNDDLSNFGVSLNYTPNEYVLVSAGYAFQENDSSLDLASFTQNVLNLTASLRY